jgi:hypothetical protein
MPCLTGAHTTLSACRRISIELTEHATDPAADLSLGARLALMRLAIAIEIAAAKRAGAAPLIGDGVETFHEAVERAEGEPEKEATLPERWRSTAAPGISAAIGQREMPVCYPACNVGSDSHSMMSAARLSLVRHQDQQHASEPPALVLDPARFGRGGRHAM